MSEYVQEVRYYLAGESHQMQVYNSSTHEYLVGKENINEGIITWYISNKNKNKWKSYVVKYC